MIISKTNITLFISSLWIHLFAQSEITVENIFTGSKFIEVENYVGVTVVVNLTDGPAVFCMGLMVNWNTNLNEGVFEYVLTTITCIEQEGISEITICIQGSPYLKTCSFTRGILEDKIFYHPLFEKLPPLGNIALIRMSESYSGKTYPISKITPTHLVKNYNIKQGITVIFWSDSLEYKPLKYNMVKSSSIIRQLQTMAYTTNTNECPLAIHDKEQADREQKFWYMFMCADFTAPTRNYINNPGAQLLLEDKILGLYSHTFTKKIEFANNKTLPKIKTGQVHRYSLLYWYVPWIERTIATDINRQGEITYDDEFNMTRSTTTHASKDPGITVPSEYFHIDNAYDDLSINMNPCGNEATRSVGRFKQEIIRLYLVFFVGVTFLLRLQIQNC